MRTYQEYYDWYISKGCKPNMAQAYAAKAVEEQAAIDGRDALISKMQRAQRVRLAQLERENRKAGERTSPLILAVIICPIKGQSLKELYNWYKGKGLSVRRAKAYAQEQWHSEAKALAPKPVKSTSYDVDAVQAKDTAERSVRRVPEFQGVTSGSAPDRRDRHHTLRGQRSKVEVFKVVSTD